MHPMYVPELTTQTPAILIKLAAWVPDDDRELPRQAYGYREGMTGAELLDSTRAWWVLSQPRAERYSHAVAVSGEITRGVWRIGAGSWRQATLATAQRLGLSRNRFAFRGVAASHEVIEAFIGQAGRSVPSVGVFGSGSVIAYWH